MYSVVIYGIFPVFLFFSHLKGKFLYPLHFVILIALVMLATVVEDSSRTPVKCGIVFGYLIPMVLLFWARKYYKRHFVRYPACSVRPGDRSHEPT